MKNFISQSVVSLFQTNHVDSASIKSYDNIMKFAQKSSQLQSRLTSIGDPAMNTKKIIAEIFTLDFLETGLFAFYEGKHFDDRSEK